MTDLAESLKRVLADHLGDLEIHGLTRLSGGASRETWSFDAATVNDGVMQLILRRDPPGAARAGNPGGMAVEAHVLQAARLQGVPVPKVITSGDADAGLDAAFIVMERIDGETIPRKILRDDAYADARPLLARQCGTVLARIHRIDPQTVPGLSHTDQITQYRDAMDTLGEPHPAFELGFRWLEQRRPPDAPPVVVHGDFRNGNMIIGPDGLRAVLDWELVHVGDPMEDLGWLCTKAWRFGVVDKPVGGFGGYADLIAGYEDESGHNVDRDVLKWWEVLGTLKWGVICIMQAATHLSGAVRSVELAAIGRRVCENEWDLLELIK